MPWGRSCRPAWALTALLLGCGDAPAPRLAEAPVASAPVAPGEPARALPASLEDLAQAAPANATAYLHLPGYRALEPFFRGLGADGVLELVGPPAAEVLGVTSAELLTLLRAVEAADLFLVPQGSHAGPPVAAVLRFEDTAAVEAWLLRGASVRPGERQFERSFGSYRAHLGWFPTLRVLVVSPRADVVEACSDALLGARASFVESPLFQRGRQGEAWLVADLARLPDDDSSFEAGSSVALTLPSGGAARLQVRLLGTEVPRLADVLSPSRHALVARLPSGAAGVFSLSLARPEGKTLRDAISALGAMEGQAAIDGVADALLRSSAGMSLSDLDRALGDELAVATFVEGPPRLGLDAPGRTSLVGLLAARDEQAARSLVAAAAKLTAGRPGAKSSPGKLVVPLDGGSLRVESARDAVAFSYGEGGGGDRRLAALGKPDKTLGADDLFVSLRRAARAESQAFYYFDYTALAALDPAIAAALQGAPTKASFLDLTLAREEKGFAATLQIDGAAAFLGTAAAVATLGVQRYLAAARTAEARNTVRAIARGAVGAYEREVADGGGKASHALCASASAPVPAEVPKGKKHHPSSDAGRDFETGTTTAGWRCLKFSITEPFAYRYDYRQGSGYRGPARGGPNPGPRGFEASAEGDLDGDGKTSLFTVTGKVGPTGVVLAAETFVADELE